MVHLIRSKLIFKLQSRNRPLIKDFKCFGEVGEKYRVFLGVREERLGVVVVGRRARLEFRYRSNEQVTINNHFAGSGGERGRGCGGWGSGIASRAMAFMVLGLGVRGGSEWWGERGHRPNRV